VKIPKYQTPIFIFSLLVLFFSLIVQCTGLATKLAALISSSSITPFIEKHIIHRSLDPLYIVRNWTNIIKRISEVGVLLAAILLFLVREKWFLFVRDIPRFIEFISKLISGEIKIFFLCGLFGAVFFIATFGTAILDVTNTGWLMAEGSDLSQHYVGWRFFRKSPWYFPIGLMDNIIYPFKLSIIFTDSIPLFAVFFKLLSPILPENFQYFGVFGLLVWFLQGGISAIVIQKLCRHSLFSVIGSMFFIFSTTMMQRIFAHTSLASHFIILLCIYAYLCLNTRQNLRRNIAVWGGLFTLGASLHMYFLPIVFVFMVASAVKNFLETRKLCSNIISCVASLFILFSVMFVLGAFYSGVDTASDGLGYYSMNVNALLNSQNTSRFLKGLPHATDGQYEGYGYLGFGILLGCFFIVCFALLKSTEIKQTLQNARIKRNGIILTAVLLFFFIFALSPAVTFNDKELFKLYVIPIAERFWGTFRSTGRFVWVLQYMIICGMIVAIKNIFGVRKGLIFICVLLAVQYLDLKKYFFERGSTFRQRTEWVSPLTSTGWDEIIQAKRHLFFVYGGAYGFGSKSVMFALADFARLHALTTNDMYIARSKNWQKIEQRKIEERNRILEDNASGETIYIFETIEQTEEYRTWLNIVILDGIVIGVKK